MSRRSAREAAVKIIFQNEFIDQRLMTESDVKGETLDAESMLAMYLNSISEEEGKKLETKYILKVLEGVPGVIEELDRIILSHSKDWTLDRIAKMDLAILRVAIYEIKYMPDIPVSVSINEAVELAKQFSYPEASAFINGVLGSVSRK
ncbi:MAG: transcription antitermination factor NusB [Clostridia bacterium]|nr:transcription antitermination factor NusB [Clostridia bacterium]